MSLQTKETTELPNTSFIIFYFIRNDTIIILQTGMGTKVTLSEIT